MTRPEQVPERGVEQLIRAGRSFLALGAGNYGAMVVALGTNALLARRLGAEHFGRLALLLMASQVVMLVAVNWSHVGFVRFGAREFAASGTVSETLWARFAVVGPAAGLGIAVAVAGREFLAAYLGIQTAAVWLLLAHFLAVCALSIMGAVFQARAQMARYGACLFLDKAAMLLCVVAGPAAWTATALATLVCYTVSSLAVVIWAVAVLGVRSLRPVWPRREALRQFWRYCAPLMLMGWAGLFGTSWFDLVILKWYVPMSGIGTYSVATQVAGVVHQVTVVFSILLLPELSLMVAEGQHARLKLFVDRLLPYWLLATSILFSVVLLTARAGIPLVFGSSYADAAPVLALFMVQGTSLALYNASIPLIGAYGSTWVLTGIAFASITVNVVMNLVLIPRFGIVGSAMATVLTFGASAWLGLAFVQRRVGGNLMRLTWMGAPVVVVCGCFFLLADGWFYPVAMVLGAGSVLALVKCFDLFRGEDKVFLRGLGMAVASASPGGGSKS